MQDYFAMRNLIVFSLLALAGSAQAQVVVREAPPATPPGEILVRVRSALGGPLNSPAMVRLSSLVGSYEQRGPIQEGGVARFPGLPFGNYRIEVSATGFDIAEETTEVMPGATVTVYITMRPEGARHSSSLPSNGAVLSPKARKELEKGIADLNAGKLKDARERFGKVAKMAPGHPDAYYLLAVVAFQEKDSSGAETHLKKALNLQPTHTAANSLLGRILLKQNDAPGAIQAFETALVQDPGVWETQALLANAYVASRQIEKAIPHLVRALELSSGRMPQLRVVLADLLLQHGKKEEAARHLDIFLTANPNHAAAAQARQLLIRARPAEAANLAFQDTTLVQPTADTSLAMAAVPPSPAIEEGNWAPKDVDEITPVVASDVTCSLPDVMKRAGMRVTQLSENLQGVTAQETVEHAELDGNGVARSVVSKSFDYMVSIQPLGQGLLSVEEMRDGRLGLGTFPTQMATRGLAALALVFYPTYATDLEFRCEGLGQWKGQAVWQLYFKQNPHRENRIRSLQTRQGRFALPLKGRVWIAANSYQILRMETDLVAPVEKAELEREHIVVEYQPVEFKEKNLQLWLPDSAELHFKLAGKRYRQRHQFSNFTYFSVETKQKISDPKTPPQDPPR